MSELPTHVYDRLDAAGIDRDFADRLLQTAQTAREVGDVVDVARHLENGDDPPLALAASLLLHLAAALANEFLSTAALPRMSNVPCDRCGKSLNAEQLTRAAGSASCLDCTLATTTDDLARIDISAGLLRELRNRVL